MLLPRRRGGHLTSQAHAGRDGRPGRADPTSPPPSPYPPGIRAEVEIDLTGPVPVRRVPGGRRLTIAMIGQKGLPATYGGIEHHVEEIATRLAAYGHDVHVFCRDSYGATGDQLYRGVHLHRVPTVSSKHLDAIAHSVASALRARSLRPDVVHFHALGPGLVAPLPRYLSRSKVVLTVHGLDHQRDKWGLAGRAALGTAHWMSARVPDRTVVVSRALGEHYRHTFDRPTTYIANGVQAQQPQPAELIHGLGLRPDRYLLWVGRLVPEKAPHLLIRAFQRADLGPDLRLVIAGGSSFTDEYARMLRRVAAGDPRIVFPGFVYGRLLNELYAHARSFVIPSTVEGLPLTLLEALSYGTPVVASDIEPHREVLRADRCGARLFACGDEADLVRALRRSDAQPELERDGAMSIRTDVLRDYSWAEATALLERLYLDLTTGAAARPGSSPVLPSAARPAGAVPPAFDGGTVNTSAHTPW